MQRINLEIVNHVPAEIVRDYIRRNATLDIPVLGPGAVNDATLYVVGGGPSVARHLDELRNAKGVVVTVNGCHDYLLREGVNVAACMLVDSAEDLVDLVTDPRPGIVYLIGSQCHPRAFEKLKGYRVVLWHALDSKTWTPDLMALIPSDCIGIYGGSTAVLRWLHVGHAMGFRKFRIYGLDSSFEDDDAYHAYPGKLDQSPQCPATVTTASGETKTFRTNVGLVMQARNYLDIIKEPWASDCTFEVIGDGFLPTIVAGLTPDEKGQRP